MKLTFLRTCKKLQRTNFNILFCKDYTTKCFHYFVEEVTKLESISYYLNNILINKIYWNI